MGIAVPSGSRRVIGPRVLGLAAGAALMVAVLLVLNGGREAATQGPRPLPPAVNAAGLLDAVGARVLRVTSAGDGGLIDVRYQIVDAEKAVALHDVKRPPALVDEQTGQVISRQIMGMNHAHGGTYNNGETYFYEFEDSTGLLQPGDRVSVVLGPVRLEHVRVQ